MKKLLNMIVVLVSLTLANQGIAASANAGPQNCAGSYENLNFWAAWIYQDGTVGCSYRYCYYTCDYASYKKNGTYRPLKGPWETEAEGRLGCYDLSSYKCQFIAK